MEDTLLKAINHYGIKQLDQLQEELAELIVAINKYKRGFQEGKKNIIEEIADVEIMIKQVKYLLAIDIKQVDNIKEYKINRLEKRLTKMYKE